MPAFGPASRVGGSDVGSPVVVHSPDSDIDPGTHTYVARHVAHMQGAYGPAHGRHSNGRQPHGRHSHRHRNRERSASRERQVLEGGGRGGGRGGKARSSMFRSRSLGVMHHLDKGLLLSQQDCLRLLSSTKSKIAFTLLSSFNQRFVESKKEEKLDVSDSLCKKSPVVAMKKKK